MVTVRRENDSMGAIDVPADKLWGAQTQRSLEHFRISTEKMPVSLIHALALTKRAAAKVNQDLGLLVEDKAEDFAGAVVKFYGDEKRLAQLSQKTQEYIKAHFSVDAAWEVIREDFEV